MQLLAMVMVYWHLVEGAGVPLFGPGPVLKVIPKQAATNAKRFRCKFHFGVLPVEFIGIRRCQDTPVTPKVASSKGPHALPIAVRDRKTTL